MALLEIRNLTVSFETSTGLFHAVKGIDLSVQEREVLAVVGESGSGKSGAAAQDGQDHRRRDDLQRA